jgi:hypothetical protein
MISMLRGSSAIFTVWASLCLAGPIKAQQTTGSCLAKREPRRREPCEEPASPSPGLPLRTLGWLCGPNQDHCEGNFPIEAGSGGAKVVGFYNQIRDKAAKGIRVDWKCPPDEKYEVSITLRINKRTWQAKTPCSIEHYDDFAIRSLRGWEGGSAALVVQLLTDRKCALPVYLSARMTTPEGYFIQRRRECRNLKSSDACLVVYSNFSSPDGWQILAGDAIRKGDAGARMDEVELLVQRPSECQPIDLSVDFLERETQKSDKLTAGPALQGRTYIGELRFQ